MKYINHSLHGDNISNFFSEPRGLELHEDEGEDDNLSLDDDDDDAELEEREEPEMKDDDDDELGPEPSDRQLWGRPSKQRRRCLQYLGRSLRCLRWSGEGDRRQVPWWAWWARLG